MIFQRNSSNAKTWHSMALRLSRISMELMELFPRLFRLWEGQEFEASHVLKWGVPEMGKHYEPFIDGLSIIDG
jgi:hypothetical protein